jgi:hypothetical protein
MQQPLSATNELNGIAHQHVAAVQSLQIFTGTCQCVYCLRAQGSSIQLYLGTIQHNVNDKCHSQLHAGYQY